MFRDKEIELWTEDGAITTDDYGTRTKAKARYVKTIMATVQPTSRDLLLKKYGYDIVVSKMLYCDIDKDIIENTLLYYVKEKTFYRAKKIIEWDNHMEVAIDVCKDTIARN